jgi:hypothetical protein
MKLYSIPLGWISGNPLTCGWQKVLHGTKSLILLDLSASYWAMFAIVAALLRYLLSWFRPQHQLGLWRSWPCGTSLRSSNDRPTNPSSALGID